jgi:hypothetical protein
MSSTPSTPDSPRAHAAHACEICIGMYAQPMSGECKFCGVSVADGWPRDRWCGSYAIVRDRCRDARICLKTPFALSVAPKANGFDFEIGSRTSAPWIP